MSEDLVFKDLGPRPGGPVPRSFLPFVLPVASCNYHLCDVTFFFFFPNREREDERAGWREKLRERNE